MNRFLKTVALAAVLVVGAWTLYHRDQIHSVSDAVELARQQFREGQWVEKPLGIGQKAASDRTAPTSENQASSMPRRTPVFISPASAARPEEAAVGPIEGSSATTRNSPTRQLMPAAKEARPVLRIASMRLETDAEADDRARVERLASILSNFDVVCLQDVDRSQSVARAIGELNRRGLPYRFIERRDANQTLSIAFDTAVVALDQAHWYTVNDPDHVLSVEPLVAWFRARRAPHQTAFTFTLVNIMLDPQRPDRELPYLGDLFRAVRNDGRGEDDVILAGDFHCGDRGLQMIKSENGFQWAISNLPTTTENDLQQANIVFNPEATIEYTGEAGVFDLMQRLNLTLRDALAVSKHMPVWAEFSIWEGHSPGRVTPDWPE